VIHESFLAGNVREAGGFTRVWRESELFRELREPQHAGACASCGLFDKCRGGCMAAKFFTGLPLAGPDPECVLGHGERLLSERDGGPIPRPSVDMSRRAPRAARSRPPAHPCDESPVNVLQSP
jgi:mycofactocin biosynthetic radical S-adenosylmethionine protein MftC